MEENTLNPVEMMRISQEKGKKCLQAMLETLGETREEKQGIEMNPVNTIILANVSVNMMHMVITALNDPELLEEFKKQTLGVLTEYFNTQELKLKSTLN